jgi:hypothetical protein
MEICATQTAFESLMDESTLSLPASPASQVPWPGSEKARAMTAGSGRQCSMLLNESDPLGAFSKILMESPLFTSSAEYCYVWATWDTRLGFSAFRLIQLEPSISDIESSLLPTPDAKLGKSGPDFNRQNRAEQSGDDLTTRIHKLWPTPIQSDALCGSARPGQNGHPGTRLSTAAKLWPTPHAADGTGGGSPVRHDPNPTGGRSNLRDAVKLFPTPRKEGYDAQGEGHGDLVYEVKKLYATPQAHDAKSGNAKRVGRHGTKAGTRNLNDEVLYPTPAHRDYRSPNAKPYSDRGGNTKGEQLPNFVGGSLNPRFVCQLMGYEADHTNLKHWEIVLCRNKSTRSSLPSKKPKGNLRKREP